MSWDLDYVRKMAGLTESYMPSSQQLNEAWDDDDDEDPDVARAMKQLKKQGTKLPKAKVDAEKDLSNIKGAKESEAKEKAEEEKEKQESARRAAEKKKEEAEAPKAAESDEDEDDVIHGNKAREAAKAKARAKLEDFAKKEAKETLRNALSHKKHEASETKAEEKAEHGGKMPSKEEEKKETAAEEKKEEAAKRRGKAPNADSKRQRLHAHIKANPNESRKNLLAWADKNLGMGGAYASQQIQAVRAAIKKQMTNECFILSHPAVPGFMLHENQAMGMYQWVSSDDDNREPLVLATEAEAKKVAKYLLEYKNQIVNIDKIDLDF